MNKKRYFILVILKNDLEYKIVSCYDNQNNLKSQVEERLQPYVGKALYYGKEVAYFEDDKYTLLFNSWWL